MLAKGEACKNNSKTKLIREKDTDRLPTTTAAEPPVGGGGGGEGWVTEWPARLNLN